MTEYFPRIDTLFDDLDTQAASFSSISDFGIAVDQAMATETDFLDGYLAAKKSKPKTEVVVVTAPRFRGLSLPRLIGGGGLASLLTQTQQETIRSNLKLVFPGITDAEIDALVAQIRNSPSAMVSLLRIGDIGYTTVNGVETLTIRVSQARRIIGILTSLNTPQSIGALNRMTAAIRGGRIRILRG